MNSQEKWNQKHQDRMGQIIEPLPNPRLMKCSSYLNGGRALDLACGLGGNSLFLSKQKYQVEAIDISQVAINYLEEIASKQNLPIYTRVNDLTEVNQLNWNDGHFDLVVITYYLDRALFPLLKRWIKESGYFFMETFYQTKNNAANNVSNQYKLAEKELLTEFGDWKVITFDENEQEGRQTLFCQRV
jgi:tellurite methyltransferase